MTTYDNLLDAAEAFLATQRHASDHSEHAHMRRAMAYAKETLKLSDHEALCLPALFGQIQCMQTERLALWQAALKRKQLRETYDALHSPEYAKLNGG